jgi:hypothetical protein
MGNSASGYAGIMEVWDYKYSLKLMCKVLGIPSPKVTSMVVKWTCFYVDKDIDRIVAYVKDTIAVAQIFLRLRREELLIDEIIHV